MAFHRAVSCSPVTHDASASGLGYGSDEVNIDSSSFYSFVIVVSLSIKITCRHLPSCLFVSIPYPSATINLPVSSFTRHLYSVFPFSYAGRSRWSHNLFIFLIIFILSYYRVLRASPWWSLLQHFQHGQLQLSHVRRPGCRSSA